MKTFNFTLLALMAVVLIGLSVQAQMPSSNMAPGINITIANALKEGTALHVLVANNGTNTVDLTNWKLVTDNNNSAFMFPSFMLKPKAIVTVHTHKGNNTATDLYGSNFMWNGTHDIKLLNNNSMPVYDYPIRNQTK